MHQYATYLPTLVGVLALCAITVLVLTLYQAPARLAPALAVLRGAVQLAVVSLVLGGAIRSPAWVGAALLVMFAVAAWTAARRLRRPGRGLAVVAGAMAVGVLVALGVIFATGAIDFNVRYVLALGGIVIGNAMTVATLAGRRFTEILDDRWDEIEGWLALGARPRQATLPSAREALHAALIPATDQTRTTGLVTLPGAFVGAIFGGVSPLEAGRFQIVVLAAIMAAGSLTAVLVIHALAPVRTRPVRS